MASKETIDYLKLFKVSERKYLIGIFQEGITVYKQQVRALNILFALFETGKLKKGDHIGVIGGGVAGLTLTSAALRSGLKVTIMEQKKIYLHVQYGCETRKIHPNIYEWPSKESLFPYADIPVLSWKYDTAANVSKQLYSSFKKITEEFSDHVKEIKSCLVKKVHETNDGVEVDWENDENDNDEFDILIYATGFGIEEGVDSDKHMVSYWRNDDFSQLLMPQKQQKYLISGVGDGGLIDLFRLKIFGFSIDSIIKDISIDQTSYDLLLKMLENIKEEWPNFQDGNKKKWLYGEFEKINSKKLLESFKTILKTKLRDENQVTLNSKQGDFKDVLSLNNISLLNALVAYTLFKIKAFNYQSGECILGDKCCKINEEVIPDSDIIIFRHGTNRESVLQNAHVTPDEIEKLQTEQHHNYSLNIVKRLWPFGWWSAKFSADEDYIPFIEFFTPDTQSVCSSYVAVLSKVLEHFHSKLSTGKKDFRVTLHRIVTIKDEYFFQQITPYYGTRRVGEVGRVFPIQGGTAGFSARTGKTIIMERKSDEEFEQLIDLFEFNKTKARILSKNVSSLLTMPIFGKMTDGTLASNLILYIDSSESDFFENDEDIMPIILGCTSGFIDSINSLINSSNISMAALTFPPLIISDEPLLEKKLEENKCYRNISELHEKSFSPKNSVLKFDQFYSFNIITEDEHDPFQQY